MTNTLVTSCDWKNCSVTDCGDGTWRAAVKRYGVMVVQYGFDPVDAFNMLADLVRELDMARMPRTDVARQHTTQNKSITYEGFGF